MWFQEMVYWKGDYGNQVRRMAYVFRRREGGPAILFKSLIFG